MCANQPSRVSKVLTLLKDLGQAWGWTFALPALVLSFVSLWFAISSYHIASRGAVPEVVATGTRIKATSDPNSYTLEVYFKNNGKEDATAITLTAGTINLTIKETKQLASEKFARLSAALWYASTARLSIRKTDLLKFLVICISYSDDSGETLAPDVTFYSVPDRPPMLNGNDAVPENVPAEEREALLSGFSCAKMALIR
jgi:hypothetical protein